MHTKYFNITLVVLAVASLIAHGCRKTEYKPIGTPYSKLEGITGTWEIANVSQVDEQSPVKEEKDLTDYYLFDADSITRITFDASDFTYEVVPGKGKNYFGTNGTWAFDDDNFPKYVFLYSVENDTTKFTLGSPPRSFDPTMGLDFSKFCGSADSKTAVISYKFTFNRVQ